MRIRWTTPAAEDLEQIHRYQQANFPHRATSTVREITTAIRTLRQFPNRGRRGNEEGTRELPHPRLPYIIVYRVPGAIVEILHIWHPAQDWQ